MQSGSGRFARCWRALGACTLAFGSVFLGAALTSAGQAGGGEGGQSGKRVNLPSSKVLLNPLPGRPQQTNSFPTAAVFSPDGRYLALLNNGWGIKELGYRQSIGILDTRTNELSDYP